MASPTSDRCLHAGFLDQLAQRPDATCLELGGRERSYADFGSEAQALAGALCSLGEAAPARVGVWSARGEVGFLGILSSLFSGAAFVPLNPSFPRERTRTMLEIADVDAIVAEDTNLDVLLAALETLPRPPALLLPRNEPSGLPAGLPQGSLGPSELERFSAPPRELSVLREDATAYILFTSGSTGQPKGVPITHANVRNYLEANQERYAITSDDRHSMTCDFTFDHCIFDTFMAWNAGARVCPLGTMDQLTAPRFVDRNGITVWFAVPSLIALLERSRQLKPGCMPSLRWSLFAGEALPLASAEAWVAAAPSSTLENLYGPTELAVDVTSYRFDPERSPSECTNGTVPVGLPYPNMHVLLLDEHGRAADEGLACFAGPQTFPGYWRNRAKTSEAMFDAPDLHGTQRRWYRTGDRLRRLPSGNLIYLGRADSQVQVLGSRVELGEVEAALRSCAGVTMGAVVPWPVTDLVAEGLVAFVTGEGLSPEALAASLRERLPPFCLPRRVMVLDALPLNANGKIDRPALTAQLAAEHPKR